MKLSEGMKVLRTQFITTGGCAAQVVLEELDLALPVINLQGLIEAELEARVKAEASDEVRRPFDLSRGPLLRAKLLRLGESEHILLLTMHHIITDGWSTGIFNDELSKLYSHYANGIDCHLEELPVQYADYSIWQREWLRGEVLETQLRYWTEHLRGAPDALSLPLDRTRPAIQTFRSSRESFELGDDSKLRLLQLSRREGATLYMTLLAAFQTLLCRYTNQRDVCVGTGIANRSRAETERLIGCFANTLVMRTTMDGEPNFKQVLSSVRETALRAYAHQDLPFEQLVEAIQPPRTLSHTPLVQVTFTFQNAPIRALELGDLTIKPIRIENGSVEFDLSVIMTGETEQLRGAFVYCADLFDSETIRRMISHFYSCWSR